MNTFSIKDFHAFAMFHQTDSIWFIEFKYTYTIILYQIYVPISNVNWSNGYTRFLFKSLGTIMNLNYCGLNALTLVIIVQPCNFPSKFNRHFSVCRELKVAGYSLEDYYSTENLFHFLKRWIRLCGLLINNYQSHKLTSLFPRSDKSHSILPKSRKKNQHRKLSTSEPKRIQIHFGKRRILTEYAHRDVSVLQFNHFIHSTWPLPVIFHTSFVCSYQGTREKELGGWKDAFDVV